MEGIRECIKEMDCFVRGGRPGIARLLEVYKNIFIHFEISSHNDVHFVIKSLGLKQDLQTKMMKAMHFPEDRSNKIGVKSRKTSLLGASRGARKSIVTA